MPKKRIGNDVKHSSAPFALPQAVDAPSALHFGRVELYEPRRAPLPCAARRGSVRKQVFSVFGLHDPLLAFFPRRLPHVALERRADVDLPRTLPVYDMSVGRGRNRRLLRGVRHGHRDPVSVRDLVRRNRVHARAADPEVGDRKRVVRRVEPLRGVVHHFGETSVRAPYGAPVVASGRVGDAHVLEGEALWKRPHVPSDEKAREENAVDGGEVPEEEVLGLVPEVLRTWFLLRLAHVHLVPLRVAPQHAIVRIPDASFVRPEDVDVRHHDIFVRTLRKDRVAGRPDGDVAVKRAALYPADDERVVADIQPGALDAEVPSAVRHAVRAHHCRKRLHVAEHDVVRPAAVVERAGVDELDVLHRHAGRMHIQESSPCVLRLVEAEDVGHGIEHHPASVDVRALRLHDETRIEHRSRRNVDLLHRIFDENHSVLSRRIHPTLHVHDAGRALLRNLRRVLRRVGEYGEDGLVVVVDANSEIRGPFERYREDSVPEFALESKARRKHGVRLHVLAERDIDPDRPAVERELAEAAVYVASARACRKRRLLAVVVHHETLPLRALRDPHRICVVALYPRVIRRIRHDASVRDKRSKRDRRDEREPKEVHRSRQCRMINMPSTPHFHVRRTFLPDVSLNV